MKGDDVTLETGHFRINSCGWGYLSPEGVFYTAKPMYYTVFMHHTIAEAIIAQLYKQDPNTIYGGVFTRCFDFLYDKGWLRIDIRDIWPDEELPAQQIIGLYGLYLACSNAMLKKTIAAVLEKNDPTPILRLKTI